MAEDVLKTAWIESPFGRLFMGELNGRLCLLSLGEADERPLLARLLRRLKGVHENGRAEDLSLYREVSAALDAMAEGRAPDHVPPLALIGSAFQCQVWQALRAIPRGETVSYRALAERLGRPSAVRAVAQAVAANPIGFFVPCHRVIGSDGSLTGFAGGLSLKRRLLILEGALAGEAPS